MATLVAGEGGDLASLHEHHAQALKQDHDLDEVCGLGIGAVEAGLALLIADVLADDDQGDDAQRGADTQDLVNEVVDGPVADDRPAALRVEGLDISLEPDQCAKEEAHHDEPVGDSDPRLLGHLRVAQDFLDQVAKARAWVIRALQRRLAQADRLEDLQGTAEEENPGWDGEQRANDPQGDRDIPRNVSACRLPCCKQVHGVLLYKPVSDELDTYNSVTSWVR